MSASSENYGVIICGLSFGLGALFSAAWLNQARVSSGMADQILAFGDWISSFAGFTGYLPSLFVSSLLIGLICFCITAGVLPHLEEWVARQGADRAKRALLKEGKISVEDEMKALVKKFGRKKPV